MFEILAQRKKPARVVGCEVQDPRDLMAFNNPQELLAIEEVYRQRQGQVAGRGAGELAGETLAPAGEWDNLLRDPSAAARRQFRQWYGEEVPWQQIRNVLGAFMHRYGADRQVAIVRSPGRINLMGRHIDHQGGTVNVMAVNREIIMVAAPRTDDVVSLANTAGTQFSEETFRISDLVASLNWDDWQRVIDGPRLQRLLEAARGDWANYVKAAILRLQELFRDRRLRGLDMMVSGDIPMGAGLEFVLGAGGGHGGGGARVQSAAGERAAAGELVRRRRMVCRHARRGGGPCGHQALASRLRDAGGLLPVPHRGLGAVLPGARPGGLQLGHLRRQIPRGAQYLQREGDRLPHRPRLVQDAAARPGAADRAPARHQRRSTSASRRADFAQLLCQLPARITRTKVQAAFGQMAEAERDRLERMFLSHEAPADGYAVRGVVLFGLSEMARAQRCLDLLKRNDARGLGRLMNSSHDGDRVSRETVAQHLAAGVGQTAPTGRWRNGRARRGARRTLPSCPATTAAACRSWIALWISRGGSPGWKARNWPAPDWAAASWCWSRKRTRGCSRPWAKREFEAEVFDRRAALQLDDN